MGRAFSIMIKNHHDINYTQLGIEILSKALDDICPRFVEYNSKFDKLTRLAAKEAERFCGKIHLGQVRYIKNRFDSAWNQIESQYLQKRSALEQQFKSTIQKIKLADNTLEIDLKLDKAMQVWDNRKKSLERRIQARRRGFTVRVDSQKGQKYTPEEVKDLKVGLENKIAREIREFEKKREVALEKIKQSYNFQRNLERLTEKQVVYETKLKNLEKSFARQVDIFNKQIADEDLFGAALDWFVNDIDKVNFWCTLVKVPLNVCYHGVKERLDLMKFESEKIDKILLKLKTGEITPSLIQIPKFSTF
jgi:hypothetical protein